MNDNRMRPKPQTLLLTIHRGLYELGSYAKLALQRGSSGMAPVNLHDHGNGMLGVWAMLAGEWVVMMMLAWYLEQVRARQHPDAVSTALDCSGSRAMKSLCACLTHRGVAAFATCAALPARTNRTHELRDTFVNVMTTCRCMPAAQATAGIPCTSWIASGSASTTNSRRSPTRPLWLRKARPTV